MTHTEPRSPLPDETETASEVSSSGPSSMNTSSSATTGTDSSAEHREAVRWVAVFATVVGAIGLALAVLWLARAQDARDEARSARDDAQQILEEAEQERADAEAAFATASREARDVAARSEDFLEINQRMIDTAAEQILVSYSLIEANTRGDAAAFNDLAAEARSLADTVNDLAAESNDLLG